MPLALRFTWPTGPFDMTEPFDDSRTIASLQTPPGKGGIAVIRLIGPRTGAILADVFRVRLGHMQGGRGVLQLGHLTDGERVIDEAVVFQCQDLAEINIHGGPAAAKAAMELLVAHGARAEPAEAGNFPPAHRQWNNPAIGCEMLDCLVRARSSLVVAAISRQWSGGISQLARQAMGQLLPMEAVVASLRTAAAGISQVQRLLDPAEVVLAGPPNAGKSSLANALIGREVSIVHESAGTTRDWVRELALLEGIPIYLTDTAGIWDTPTASPETRHTPAAIDAESVRRAREQVRCAKLVVLVEAEAAFDVPRWLGEAQPLRVSAKCDIRQPAAGVDVAVSTHTGQGLDALRRAILTRLGMAELDPSVPRAFTLRQADLLTAAADSLQADNRSHTNALLSNLLVGR